MSEPINEHLKKWARPISDSDWPFPAKRMNVGEETPHPLAQDDATGSPYGEECKL
jgi:hypothetical protein